MKDGKGCFKIEQVALVMQSESVRQEKAYLMEAMLAPLESYLVGGDTTQRRGHYF